MQGRTFGAPSSSLSARPHRLPTMHGTDALCLHSTSRFFDAPNLDVGIIYDDPVLVDESRGDWDCPSNGTSLRQAGAVREETESLIMVR
jgi:hypothetical protein